jgi:hypothetical protein
MRLYFDNNVIDPIAVQGAGSRVKALLKKHGATAFGSIQNLSEILRTNDHELRATLVRTLIQIARDRERDAIPYRQALALVRAMERLHPDWLNPQPHKEIIDENLMWRRHAWDRLLADPYWRPKGQLEHAQFLHDTVGRTMASHRKRREGRKRGELPSSGITDPEVLALRAALPKLEAYWRDQMGWLWWKAVIQGDPKLIDLRGWLLPYILPDRLDYTSWMRFWLVEVDAKAMAASRVWALAEFFQTEHKVESGDTGDLNHAMYSVGRDYLFTADVGFLDVLTKVSQVPNTTIARPILIDRSAADIEAELERGMGW